MRDFLRHLFVPHHTNRHKAKLLHHSTILSLTVLLFVATFVVTSLSHSSKKNILGIASNVTAQDLLTLTNLKRQENSLPPLVMNDELTQAAAGKAEDMFTKDYWAHVSPDGTTPWVFIKNAGYNYLYAGENLARGYTTSGDVVDAWMASPSHRENMLSPNYHDIGFAIKEGVLTGDETILVVEELGSRSTAVAQATSAQTTTVARAVTPTPTSLPIVTVAPTSALQPTAIPTPTIAVIGQLSPTPTPPASETKVAAVHNDPLIDSASLKQDGTLVIVSIFILLLGLDIVIVQRQNLARFFSHNLDHLIFFFVLLLLIILIGGGAIL
jgi:uncharacterized protein YkwD